MVSTFPNPSSVDLSRIRLSIRSLQPQLVEWRRRLHQQPELGFQEKLTAEFVSQKLQEWGIDNQTSIAQTGIVATIKGNKPPTPHSPLLRLRSVQVATLLWFTRKPCCCIGDILAVCATSNQETFGNY